MRRFEFRAGGSLKFWTVAVRGTSVTTTWGRIGTEGQTKTKAYPSATAARAAADKQVAEKLGKGYRETKAGAKPSASSPSPPPVTSPHVSDDELFARGYPHLRRLAPDQKKQVAKTVQAELEAIDPYFDVDVPADVARAFLGALAHPRKDSAARAAAIANPPAVDRALLDAVLKRLCPALVTEIYAFRIQDAAFLFEAFLGTELVADALVQRFIEVVSKPRLWTQKDNGNDHAFHWTNALGFMRLRLSPARWKAITAPLAKVKPTSLLFSERLRLLADPKRPVPSKNETLTMQAVGIALQRGDAKALRAYHAKHGAYWYSARFYHVAGVELLAGFDPKPLLRQPGWLQKRVVAEYGRLPGAPIRAVMETLATGRAAVKEAKAWLAARGSSSASPRAATRPLTQAQVAKLVGKAMREIEKGLPAAKGDQAKERAILAAAYQTYCEARAAGGDPIPEAYFTHQLIDLDWKRQPQADVTRWFDLAIEVAS